MRQPRLAIAQPDIVRLLDQHSLRIFRRSDLEKVLADNREYLRLTRSTTTSRFIDFLLARTRLKMVKLKFPSRKEVRYILGDVSPYALALSIRPRSYLTHYSAMHIHGLTEQIPKTVYVNAEQPQKRVPNASLTQERIDAAFRHPPRKSKNRAVLPGVTVCLLAGMHTGQLGVIQAKIPTGETVSVTNIERTLIDIVVRPFYAGGIYEVLEAYRRARGSLSINKLVATLKKLNYTYPYHQAVGFFLERAGGYANSAVALLHKFPMKYDFYLSHQMGQTDYSERWRLFFPKGF